MSPNKKTGGSSPPRPSRRKATTARKTKKVKTKITKTGVAQTVSPVAQKQTVTRERVVTIRHKRMAERAAVRASMPEAAPAPPEVKAMKITDVAGVVYDADVYQDMVDMYDATIRDIKEGEIVAGMVMSVSKEDVVVDVGFKSEGIIQLSEFPLPLNIKVGDEIEVFLEQVEDSHGQLVLSKQKADFVRVWDKIRESHDSGEKVEGRVFRRIKGGLVVDIMGVDAFLPGSQVALRQVPDFDALIDQVLELKIIKINKNRRNIVVSRRIVLEEERETMRSSLLSEIAVGQVRQGIVKNITDFGVFIDLGGVDGLLHITDMSWGRIRHPSEMVSLGDNVDVKILDFDENTSRISLGFKQLTPYPWENVDQKYPIGKRVKGRVVSITDYGAFVEVEKGVEGLIHISEMSWTQHIKHPSKIMNVNDDVEAVVLSVDKEHEKISLGIKQMEPDPWATIEDKYPIGDVIAGKVRNLTAFGAFVELEEGIDGLVHISDMSWTKRIQHPSEVMRKGEDVEVKILRVDNENRRISLGFKQLTDDPWPEISKKYAVGTECLGTVSRVMDRGVIVDLDGSVEGFVPTAQLGRKDLTDPTGVFNEGESIPLQVIELERNQHKIVLSVYAYYKKREQVELDEFVSSHSSESASQMADAMPDELKQQVEQAETESAPEPEVEDKPAAEEPAEEVATSPEEVAEPPEEVTESPSEVAEPPDEVAEPPEEASPTPEPDKSDSDSEEKTE